MSSTNKPEPTQSDDWLDKLFDEVGVGIDFGDKPRIYQIGRDKAKSVIQAQLEGEYMRGCADQQRIDQAQVDEAVLSGRIAEHNYAYDQPSGMTRMWHDQRLAELNTQSKPTKENE